MGVLKKHPQWIVWIVLGRMGVCKLVLNTTTFIHIDYELHKEYVKV